MLRITPCTSAGKACLILEGRLAGDWVPELEAAARDRPAGLQLDLARVRFVDADGLALLHRLRSQGAVVRAASGFVAQLLKARSA